jgi:hypothetical protein
MIAKPPVTSVELAFPLRPFLLPGDVLLRIVWGDAFGKRRCLLLKNVFFPRGYFANTMPWEAFNCDYFRTILSGET